MRKTFPISLKWEYCNHLCTDPNQLECYYCYGHAGTEHDNCDEDIPGDKVVCQMHDPRQPNYGDACFIGHTGWLYSFI